MVEEFVSFIWTSRANAFGDFELKFASAKFPKFTAVSGNYIEYSESNRLMEIETIKMVTDSEGNSFHILTGRSLERLLLERVVTPNTTKDYWTLTGKVGWIIHELVRRICVDGIEFSPDDKIDNLTIRQLDPSTKTTTVKLQTKTLYEAIQELCEEDSFNFQVYFNRSTKGFEFTLYRGEDRTSSVVFGDVYDNVSTDEYIHSSLDYKNVAYVRSGTMIRQVVAGSAVPTGSTRRVMYVDASDIEEPTAAKLDARGKLELAKKNRVKLYSAEIDLTRTNVFGIDYNVGDIVAFVDMYGETHPYIVSESVITYDREGERKFPTFRKKE